MALSFLSDSVKTQIKAVFDNVHDTFGRDIIAYKDAQETISITTAGYNSRYGSPVSVSKTTVSQTFKARIKYIKSSEELLRDSQINSQLKISLPEGIVRIKVDAEGFNFIKEAKRIELDGQRYTVLNDSIPKIIGPFDPQYYSFYLVPLDEDA